MNRKGIAAVTLAAILVAESVSVVPVSVNASGKTQGKEEVIYVMTDAAGVVDSINVVNIFGKGKVTDYGDYSAVKMLTTTDAIIKDGDEIQFSTDKEKVYYQGTLKNTEIPWKIEITYTLDGKKYEPEELAGKSGALKIHISITENKDCDKNFYDSYALQAAFTLDVTRCENIKATGATMANVGADKQISYTVLPGKGLDADITADVTNFEMDAASINGVKLNLDVEVDDSEITDKVSEVQDAAGKLDDGATKLQDGSDQLEEGGKSVKDGAKSLQDGADSLNQGIASLNSGIVTVQSGLNTLNAQSSSLTSGSSQIQSALKQVQTSLNSVSVDTTQLKTLTDSSSQIKQAITDLYSGATALQSSLSYQAYKDTLNQKGLSVDQLQSQNTAAISSIQTQLTQLQAMVQQCKQDANYADSPQLQQQAAMLEGQIDSLKNVATLLNGNNAAISGTQSYFNAMSSGADSLVKGLAALKESYAKYDAAIVQLSNTLSSLAVNMTQLKSGIDTLVTEYGKLDTGIQEYTSGLSSITTGYSKVKDGSSKVVSGSKSLVTGSKKLKNGTNDLYGGIGDLQKGTNDMKDGTSEFVDKTANIDTEVEDKINDMIDSLSGNDSEIESFVSDKNTNVESVQFVIKTDAIELPDNAEESENQAKTQTFWQKLTSLFTNK